MTDTASDLATEWQVSKRKVTDTATRLGVGANFGGRAGYRFSAADKAAIWEALRPKPLPSARRRRRAA